MSHEGAAGIGVGSVLCGRYLVTEANSNGAFGALYMAIDQAASNARERGARYRLRVLDERRWGDVAAVAAVQSQAARSERLRHPHIFSTGHIARDEGLNIFFAVAELREGVSLSRFINERRRQASPLSFGEAWPMVKGLGDGLQHIHDAGFVYTDLKPSNVFVDVDGTTSVMELRPLQPRRDGGAARPPRNERSTDFGPGITVGFASPEMMRGAYPEPRDDLFALAIVVYMLLTLTHPFDRKSADEAHVALMVPKAIDGLSQRSMTALEKGLAFERRDRQPDVAAFLDEFCSPRPFRGLLQKARSWFASRP